MSDAVEMPDLAAMSTSELEAWFLGKLGADPFPSDALIGVVAAAYEQRGSRTASGLADLLRDALAERHDTAGLIRLFRLGAEGRPDDPAFRDACRKTLERAAADRAFGVLVKHSGFDSAQPLPECLRRLDVLRALTPGAFVHDDTWGFGTVGRADDFYARVTIDYTGKRGHQMSFAYAGERLEVLSPAHWFVRLHQDLPGMKAMVTGQPDEVVRVLLRSLGPMSVPDIKERVTAGLMAESEWQGFWDAARAALKKDPAVEIPTKRNEPVRLLSRPKSCDAGWFAAVARERSPEAILEAVLVLEKSRADADATAPHLAIMAERMGFAIRGAEDSHPELAARIWMAALRMKLPLPDGVEGALLSADARLLACLQRLPAREMAVFMAEVRARCGERLASVLSTHLERLPVKAVGEALVTLAADGGGAAAACMERLRAVLREQKGVSPAVACWLAENLPWVAAQRLGDPAAVFLVSLGALEQSAGGDQLRAQKLLRERFVDSEWLKIVFDSTEEIRRSELVRRVEASNGWDAAGKRSVLARLIKLYPELGRVLAGGASGAAAAPSAAAKTRFTSWRSLKDRQEQFRKLKEEEIPANSREIAVARSYGDLRENFEYQAARDLQRMLLKREAEIQEDLTSMQGSDFANAPLDKVGMGVEVDLQRPGGTVWTIRILGEWDRDESRSVISSRSLVAERLAGRAVGDEVDLPMDGGEDRCRVAAIRELPADIRDWARG